jgi:hypothetical protein
MPLVGRIVGLTLSAAVVAIVLFAPQVPLTFQGKRYRPSLFVLFLQLSAPCVQIGVCFETNGYIVLRRAIEKLWQFKCCLQESLLPWGTGKMENSSGYRCSGGLVCMRSTVFHECAVSLSVPSIGNWCC